VRKLVAALACRAGGTRLYGKPLQLLDIDGRITVLDHLIQALRTESNITDIVLGVASGSENEPFHEIARQAGLRSIRGDQVDVLMRLIQCGEAGGATDIFRVTTESPFIYLEAIDEAWQQHQSRGNDVTHLTGLPDGCGFEIIKLDALRAAHCRGEARHRSELCTLYIKEHQEQFQVQVLEPEPACQRLELRLTIDYPEDLVLCRRVYAALRTFAPRIPIAGIVAFLDTHPDLCDLVQPYTAGERWYA
jgi:spore coat polysaccharide biosynthesis protein SpsF